MWKICSCGLSSKLSKISINYTEGELGTKDFTLQTSEVSGAAWVGVQNFDEFDIIEPSRTVIKKYLNLA